MTSVTSIVYELAVKRKMLIVDARELSRAVHREIEARLMAGESIRLPGLRIDSLPSNQRRRHNLHSGKLEEVKSVRRLKLIVSGRFKRKYKMKDTIVSDKP